MSASSDLELIVEEIEPVTPTIRHIGFRRADGGPLASYAPGSHLALDCGGRRNAYSLTGDGRFPERYTISVLRRDGGRGGSDWLHRIERGQIVRAAPPRSAFPPVADARRHLMIAGGVGVTPFLSHLRAAKLWGRDVALLYAASVERPVPHGAEIEALTDGRAEIVRNRAALRERRDALLSHQPLGTHLYICGPQSLIDETLARAQALGWPAARCHVERFVGLALDEGEAFRIHLRRSDRWLEAPAGVSLLEVLERHGIAWPYMCRVGVCGECRMGVVEGAVAHRDLVLTPAERASNACLMPCVSRADGLLTLDL
jgi:ferredoxin-NADP reductase